MGSFLMKTVTAPILRRFGFRNTLMCNGLIATAFLRRLRPVPAQLADAGDLRGAGGGRLLQSLQFTAYNTVAYDEIPRRG